MLVVGGLLSRVQRVEPSISPCRIENLPRSDRIPCQVEAFASRRVELRRRSQLHQATAAGYVAEAIRCRGVEAVGSRGRQIEFGGSRGLLQSKLLLDVGKGHVRALQEVLIDRI